MADARRYTDRWRRTPLVAIAGAVVLLIAGIMTAAYSDQLYRSQKVQEVSVQAQILAASVNAALVFGDRGAAQEYVKALGANPEVEAAGVYDERNVLFAGYTRDPTQELPRAAALAPPGFQKDHLIVTAPVTQGAETLGSVYLRTLTEPLSRRLVRYGGFVLLVVMASLVVAVLGAANATVARTNAELERRATDLAEANEALHFQIEERERVEATLRQMQRLEAVGQLTSGVAHDFNNLLTVVLGNIRFLERRVDDDESRRRLGFMSQAAQRGADLTAQLLAFSRRQRLEPKAADLNQVVGGMQDLLQSTMGGSVAIRTELADGLWPALVDTTQLELVILNLAINARDAMAVGGSLTVKTDNVSLGEPQGAEEPPPGDYVMVSVSDTGSGMPPEVRARAFEPFFTTKDIGKGSGLGLAQVLGFAQQSGGGVAIETQPGDGTAVKVYLPRAQGVAVAPPEPQQAARREKAAAGQVVLLVDDDHAVREIVSLTLSDLGYTVVEAESGPAALAALERKPKPSLVLLDFAMPGMNGAAAAREIEAKVPDVPVLFITGYADMSALSSVGEERIIQKPLRDDELARKVRAALAARTA